MGAEKTTSLEIPIPTWGKALPLSLDKFSKDCSTSMIKGIGFRVIVGHGQII